MTQTTLAPIIEYAQKLHGHVGPCLVVGLKIGYAAKTAPNVGDEETAGLKAEVSVPLQPPFSCLLDGMQV